jgi:RNA polymerase sigma-70 factor (sigma-E family)
MTFEDWARQSLPGLLRFSTALCGGRHLAEDVVQEVLLRASARWDTIGAVDHPDAYLRRMVINEFLSWRRKWSRVTPRAEIDAGQVGDHAAGVVNRDALLTELAKLPRRQRTVLVLRYYCGHSDAEIAELLGCSTGTIRGYASRALATLRIDLTTGTLHRRSTSHAH